MHEYDEIYYGKNISELEDELHYQQTETNDSNLIDYIKYCIRRLKNECNLIVYWYYYD